MHLVALVPAMNWRQCYNVKDNCYWYLLLLLLLFVIGEGMESTLNGSGFVDVRFTFPNLSGKDLFVSLSLISVHITLHYLSWYPVTTIHYVNKPLKSCSPLRLINSPEYPCFFFLPHWKCKWRVCLCWDEYRIENGRNLETHANNNSWWNVRSNVRILNKQGTSYKLLHPGFIDDARIICHLGKFK